MAANSDATRLDRQWRKTQPEAGMAVESTTRVAPSLR
jgi:hypothetical protein